MKRQLIFALMLLLLLSGCTVHNRYEKPEVDNEPEEEQEPGPINVAENDSGPFSRTEIIRRNEHADGYFLETKRWVSDYAKQRWPNSEYTIDFVSGFEAPSAIFTDYLSGGSALWSVTVSQPSAKKVTETVQALYFLDGGQIYLSGLLAGDSVMKNRPDVYNYLRLDTRYASRMCEAPTIAPPEGLTVIHDLTQILGMEGASSELLDNDTALFSDIGWDAGNKNHKFLVFDIASGKILHELTVKGSADTWEMFSKSDGVVTYAGKTSDGADQVLTASRNGIKLSAPAENQINRWAMGQNRYVEFADNSLYEINGSNTMNEVRQVLLQGVKAEDDSSASFRFRKALSDDKFVYDYYGYEWFIRSGIFDLSTGTDYVISVPVKDDTGVHQKPTQILYADLNTAISAVQDYGNYNFGVTDLSTGKTRTLQIGYESANTGASRAVANKRAILLMREPNEKKTDYSFELYNLQGKRLWSWDLIGAVTGSVSVFMTNSGKIGIQFYNLVTGTTQLYIITV